jgi:hypothetical protein
MEQMLYIVEFGTATTFIYWLFAKKRSKNG